MVRPGRNSAPQKGVKSQIKLQTTKPVWQNIGDGLARKGNVIYFRTRVGAQWSWRSSHTNNLAAARKQLDAWKHEVWAEATGLLPQPDKRHQQAGPTVNQLLDEYVASGHPTVTRRGLRPKAPKSIKGERYSIEILREFFGDQRAGGLTLGDCDRYHAWRLKGGHVARYQLRGNAVTRKTKGGHRAVDLELVVASNALSLAVRRGELKANPFNLRGCYADPSTVCHCREHAPTPAELQLIRDWLQANSRPAYAHLTCFLAYSGLRIGEGLATGWPQVDWRDELMHVRREKKGIMPWVPILPEMALLLRDLKVTAPAGTDLLFPAPFDVGRPLNDSAYRRALATACRNALKSQGGWVRARVRWPL